MQTEIITWRSTNVITMVLVVRQYCTIVCLVIERVAGYDEVGEAGKKDGVQPQYKQKCPESICVPEAKFYFQIGKNFT